MGSSCSNHQAAQNGKPQTDYEEYPLLSPIVNPINRFCDDFASSLIDELKSKTTNETSIPTTELEVEGYITKRCMGFGVESEVFEAEEIRTHIPCAIKHYKSIKYMDENGPREMTIAMMLDHPNCLKILQCFRSLAGDYIVVMPLATDGSLNPTNTPQITVVGAVMLLLQIGSALNYMHEKNIMHRDVKPQNVLLFPDCYQLCDYSVSTVLKSSDEKVTGRIGTPLFMAPEVTNNMPYLPRPADMWALGVTAYSLLYGTFPFNLLDCVDQFGNVNVTRNTFNQPLTFPSLPLVPDELKVILSSLLDLNPDTRMTAAELIEDQYIVSTYEEWKKASAFLKDGTLDL
ncbi:CAMK family protein kinase [Tritrichomonas foetus]|uniref:CAMK family protein kinase n=1 Tax=Tritrichomonas foetus TaxID=1144522 RepID=A0A1J4J2K0_9EUKA|nr:CAMK family protein kinase [Tritrichomonas foetus]|eukprot:OHS93672.1 CAMK family protein kinase [Tritrichomonas foetus]